MHNILRAATDLYRFRWFEIIYDKSEEIVGPNEI